MRTKHYSTKDEWLQDNGFSATGITYCVKGGDTFSIKDTLKEQGYKFNQLLKWHAAAETPLPDGYTSEHLSFDELYRWDDDFKMVFELETAKATIDSKIAPPMIESNSDFVGKVGERLYEIPAVVDSIRSFDGAFGPTKICTFKAGENVFVWFTSANVSAAIGDTISLTGTVKEHNEYRGEKNTKLSRCIIKKRVVC